MSQIGTNFEPMNSSDQISARIAKICAKLFGFEVTNWRKFFTFVSLILLISVTIHHISFKVLSNKATNYGKQLMSENELRIFFGENEKIFRSTQKFSQSVVLQQSVENDSVAEECAKFIRYSSA